MRNRYPYLRQSSRAIGISEENLVKAFAIERHFHSLILQEDDPEQRKQLYRKMYSKVHPLYNKVAANVFNTNPFYRVVKLFKKEIYGRSILDVGCGNGAFLMCVADMIRHDRLVGIDTSLSVLPKGLRGIKFMVSDIVDFDVENPFDVVVSHHVLEHIAPSDIRSHMRSIKRALVPQGCLIIRMPNRLFGPSDVTRILDYTNRNRISAMGSHVNELSYTETIALLKYYGFSDFKTVLPVPRLKYYLPNIRINPSIVTYIESRPILLNLLYLMRVHSRCVACLDVTLICRRNNP